jgi:hypothetical protein
MKLEGLANNDVMVKPGLRISSFRRLPDSRVFSIGVTFGFKVDRVFLHPLGSCHGAYGDSEHQVIIKYRVWRWKVGSFEGVSPFPTDTPIFFVPCRSWAVCWSPCFATMSHGVEWIRKKSL